MAHYLLQATYTAETWAAMLKNPQDRTPVLASVVAKLGGRIESAYFSFGEYDTVSFLELPDNVSAAAFSMAAAAGGAAKTIKTTPLMTVAEGLEAARKAAASGYRPPS